MSLHAINDVAGLHHHARAAVQLEHATIPPRLTALYLIRPGANTEAYHIIRAVAVEEMLHLTLAANLLNAIGGTPGLTLLRFVPLFPAHPPDGETDFQAVCQRLRGRLARLSSGSNVRRAFRTAMPSPSGGKAAAARSTPLDRRPTVKSTSSASVSFTRPSSKG